MSTGDPMNWCPMCGMYYYAADGHACKPIFLNPPTWNPNGNEAMMPRLERIEKLLEEIRDKLASQSEKEEPCLTRKGNWQKKN